MARWIAVVLASLLAACAGGPTAPPAETEATVEAGYGRAFGRVEFTRRGKPVVWGGFLHHESLRLFLQPVPGGQLQHLSLEQDGTFVWPLRPGEYVIVGFEYTNASAATERITGRLMTSFAMPRAGQAVYVGDFRIDGDRSGFTVLDRYADALKLVESRLAQGKLQPVKGLVRPEARTGSYRAVVGICNKARWELSCDGNYQGVEPSRPAQTLQRFPLVESLTPLLEWKPVGKPNVRYDVAIFESLALAEGELEARRRLRGALVAYAEGLKEPRYVPANALRPGTRYEWSVRLRDEDDTVSSWSTTSQAVFLVVAASRSAGRSFGFETPAQ